MKILQIMNFYGLEKNEVNQANAGDIVAISGLGELRISDTICEVGKFEALEKLSEIRRDSRIFLTLPSYENTTLNG